MKKQLISIIIFLLLGASLHAQSKKINLNPVFEEGMSWEQTVSVVSSRFGLIDSMVQSIDLNMNVELAEFDDGYPSKMICKDVSGDQKISKINLGKESIEETIVNKEGGLTAKVDSNLCWFDARDSGKLSDDVLLFYPAGPFLGFVSPKNMVKVGESWSSEGLVPVGPKTISKKQFNFSEVKGEFRLEKVKKKMAFISWKGTAVVNEKYSVTWERLITFDLKKHFIVSTNGLIKIDFQGTEVVHNVNINVVD